MSNAHSDFALSHFISSHGIVFLDMFIFWEPTHDGFILYIRLFARVFSYFPFIVQGSKHPPHNSRAWVHTELIRRARLSSSRALFYEASIKSRIALKRKKYSRTFLDLIWNAFDFNH